MGDVTRTVIRDGVAYTEDPKSNSPFNQKPDLPGYDRNMREAVKKQGVHRTGGGTPYECQTPGQAVIKGSMTIDADNPLRFSTPDGREINDLAGIKRSDLIQVGSTKTTVAAALQQGLLRRDGSGNFTYSKEFGEIQQRELSRQTAKSPVSGVDFLTYGHKENMALLESRMGNTAFHGAMALLIHEMAKGENGDASQYLRQISDQAQIDPGKLKTWAEELINDSFSNGLEWTAQQYGIDADKAYDWVMDNWTPHAKAGFIKACIGNNTKDLEYFARMVKYGDRI